jgi:hypothetical protein
VASGTLLSRGPLSRPLRVREEVGLSLIGAIHGVSIELLISRVIRRRVPIVAWLGDAKDSMKLREGKSSSRSALLISETLTWNICEPHELRLCWNGENHISAMDLPSIPWSGSHFLVLSPAREATQRERVNPGFNETTTLEVSCIGTSHVMKKGIGCTRHRKFLTESSHERCSAGKREEFEMCGEARGPATDSKRGK